MPKVERPAAGVKRINCKEEFESCYLRHQYIRRAKYNPTREEMEPYNFIIEKFARNTFYTYKNLFLLVGLDLDDVTNAAQVHLISYLGLFALERNPKKLSDFKKLFKNRNSIRCSKEDLLNKNKANFTCFIKQRLEDMVRVCRQKAKNIKGLRPEEFIVFKGTKQPPKDIEDLLENHEKYEYHPVDASVFKTIKRRMKDKQEGPVYLCNELWYVCVPIRKKMLSLTDFACKNYDPYDNLHNMNPEEIYEVTQESSWEAKWLEFSVLEDEDKVKIVEDFIKENNKNPKFKEELRIARKFLGTEFKEGNPKKVINTVKQSELSIKNGSSNI